MSILGEFIDGFISGWNESDNEMNGIAQVPQNPNSESVQVSTHSSPQIINSFEEMSKWLTGLQRGASPAVRQAISAQIQVIQFVQSPTLVDTTFDTLMYSLDKSIAIAKNEEEKSELREAFVLMIQNYVFFMDAKLQMTVNQNKEEGRKLFIDAGEMLSNSVKDIALLAVSGGTRAEIAATTVKNLFAPENESGIRSLLKRIIHFINEEQIIYEKTKEFYDTLGVIITNLGNHQELIGESDLLSGTIKRYLPEMEAFYIADIPEIAPMEQEIDKLGEKQMGVCGILFSISLFWAIVRAFYYWVASRHVSAPDRWFLYQILWTIAIVGIVYLLYEADIKGRKRKLDQLIQDVKDKVGQYFYIGRRFEVKKGADRRTATTPQNRSVLSSVEAPEFLDQKVRESDGTSKNKWKAEQDYVEMFKEYVADGDISERDRKMLEKLRVRLGITEERAKELEEACLNPQLSEDEKEYLEMCKEYAADGEISDRDRKMLNKMRDRMGISEERAKEIEAII